ncbi:MAG: DUF3299 domain-containing protein [Rhizomicrobium sp.]
MIRKSLTLALIIPVFLLSAGFRPQQKVLATDPNAQPADERAMQDRLPKSHDALWSKLLDSKVAYNNRTGIYSITVSPQIKALANRQVTASGWVLPLDGSDQTRHFLLTRRTPVCMFCPPGEPNEVAEVVSPTPIAWTDKLVTVTGQFSLVNNGEKGIFFKIAANAIR